jgi:hypothetical protein
MKPHYLLLLALLFSTGMYYAVRPAPASTPESAAQDYTTLPPPLPVQPPLVMNEPSGPIIREHEQPANAVAVKINWKLKLPTLEKSGYFVFKDEKSFAAFLGADEQRFVRWNNINFSKQMAIVYVSKRGDASAIESLARTPAETVVFIKHVVHQNPTPVVQPERPSAGITVSGVVVNKSNLPVHLSDFDVVEP